MNAMAIDRVVKLAVFLVMPMTEETLSVSRSRLKVTVGTDGGAAGPSGL